MPHQKPDIGASRTAVAIPGSGPPVGIAAHGSGQASCSADTTGQMRFQLRSPLGSREDGHRRLSQEHTP
jgi:hypothetical protein